MIYVDTPFPKRIAMGAQRAPSWRTELVQTVSGKEATDQLWSESRLEFDISFAVRTAIDYRAVATHFYMVRGKAKAFPFKDILDYTAGASEGVVVDEGGSPSAYHLVKRYGSSAHAYDRRIRKPVSGTLTIYRTRSSVTTDVTSSATVDYDTGAVSFAGGVILPGDTMSWAGEFNVPCRYDTDRLPTMIVNRQPGDDGQLLVSCESIPVVEVNLA